MYFFFHLYVPLKFLLEIYIKTIFYISNIINNNMLHSNMIYTTHLILFLTKKIVLLFIIPIILKSKNKIIIQIS